MDVLSSALIKARQANVTILRLELLGLHGLNLDDIASDLHFFDLFKSVAINRKSYRGSLLATHFGNRFNQGHALGALFVDLHNAVVRFQTGLPSGRIFDRGNNGENVVFHPDFNSKPTKLPFGVDLHVFENFWWQEIRVRIESLEHSFNCTVHEVFVFYFFSVDVITFDEMKNFLEELQIFIALLLLRSARECNRSARRLRRGDHDRFLRETLSH